MDILLIYMFSIASFLFSEGSIALDKPQDGIGLVTQVNMMKKIAYEFLSQSVREKSRQMSTPPSFMNRTFSVFYI